MTLVDPPKVAPPDVSKFLSAPDEAELAAAEIPETDEPLGPWVSRMPVRPPQHPNRRKLSDEFEKHIGEGDPEAPPPAEPPRSAEPQSQHGDRRDHGYDRERSERRDRGERSDRRDRRDRTDRTTRPARRDPLPPNPSAEFRQPPAAQPEGNFQSGEKQDLNARTDRRPGRPDRRGPPTRPSQPAADDFGEGIDHDDAAKSNPSDNSPDEQHSRRRRRRR